VRTPHLEVRPFCSPFNTHEHILMAPHYPHTEGTEFHVVPGRNGGEGGARSPDYASPNSFWMRFSTESLDGS
jgi:hypothetical protein